MLDEEATFRPVPGFSRLRGPDKNSAAWLVDSRGLRANVEICDCEPHVNSVQGVRMRFPVIGDSTAAQGKVYIAFTTTLCY